jgi:serine/threonine protein kinase
VQIKTMAGDAVVQSHVRAGTCLGTYEVLDLLGVGGMGEVYRARDTRLQRDVAIKILPRLSSSDPERFARFDREAQLLASLNHSNIAQIYSFEHFPAAEPGLPALPGLVLELVDGPTLADRIANGALPCEEALSIARQMADALEAAHSRGIIHRDLKPANIKLTATGVVKVLDFGLAKAFDPPSSNGPKLEDLTIAGPPTLRGTILGTAAYMAPEQARGLAIDKRADLWAFGVVIYEMLTGRRPFEGETLSDVIATVLRGEIDWSRLPQDIPDELRTLLRRCLERDPENRMHDAADARLMIVDAQRAGPGSTRARRTSLLTWRMWFLVGTSVAAAIVGGALLRPDVFRTPPSPERIPLVRFTIEPSPEVGGISNVTLSADGRFIVFEGQVEGESRLFLRRLDTLESQALPGTEGGRWPFTSPDGAWIGFFRDGKIYKVSTHGGDPLAMCDVRGGPGAVWTESGRIVFSRTWLSGLSQVSADGGVASILTTPDRARQEIGHWWPAVLPGGRILFTIATASVGLNDARVGLLDPQSGRYRVLFPGARASWIPSGYILFYGAGRYRAVPFDLSSSAVTGESFPVLADAQELDPSGDWPQPVANAASGAVAYLSGPYIPPSRLTWIDQRGAATPLSNAPRAFVSVKLSPNGRRAAAASLDAGRLVIRLFDLDRGTEETPAIDGMNWNPTWLPDGRLSYTSMRKGDFDVYVKDVDATGAETAVLTGPDDSDPVAWTRDGRLIFQGSEPDGAYPLKLYDPRQPHDMTRLTEQHVENGGSLSPDERWLAYQSAATGRTLLYVRALTSGKPAAPLLQSTGEFPIFLRNGRELAFVRNRQLVVRSWREQDGRFELGPERSVTRLEFGSGWTYGAPYDVAADGRFLALVRTEASRPLRIRVVLGWDRQIVRLASTGQ